MRSMFVFVDMTAARFCNAPSSGAYSLEATSRNRKNSGIGLGLSICADIVKIHKAGIVLESKEGKGTLVKIIFPCYKQDTN